MVPYVYSKSAISELSGKVIVKLSDATATGFYSSTIRFVQLAIRDICN